MNNGNFSYNQLAPLSVKPYFLQNWDVELKQIMRQSDWDPKANKTRNYIYTLIEISAMILNGKKLTKYHEKGLIPSEQLNHFLQKVYQAIKCENKIIPEHCFWEMNELIISDAVLLKDEALEKELINFINANLDDEVTCDMVKKVHDNIGFICEKINDCISGEFIFKEDVDDIMEIDQIIRQNFDSIKKRQVYFQTSLMEISKFSEKCHNF